MFCSTMLAMCTEVVQSGRLSGTINLHLHTNQLAGFVAFVQSQTTVRLLLEFE